MRASVPNEIKQARRVLQNGKPVDLGEVGLLPPIPNPPKIICVGLNYADHSTVTVEALGLDSVTANANCPPSLAAASATLIRGVSPPPGVSPRIVPIA